MSTAVEARRTVTPLRAVAVALVLGTLLYIVPGALHGNPPVESAQRTLEYVHARPTWRPVHLVNIAAVLIWAATFPLLVRGLHVADTARRIVTTVFTTTAAVFAVYFSLHAFGLTTAANQYFDAGADRAAVLERTETILIVLGSTAFTAQALLGVAIATAGFALTRTPLAPRWLGGIGVVAGLGWLIGALIVQFAVIVPFTVATWIWTILLAAWVWRAGDRDTT